MREKVLHLLTWEWENIEKHLPMIKEYGFTAVQTSPIQECKPLWDDNGRIEKHSDRWWNQVDKEWMLLYQPLSNKIGNFLGTKEDFISLCNKGKELGIKIIPDLVIRHTSNGFTSEEELIPCHLVDTYLLQHPEFFSERININNENDRWQVTHRCTHLPMLNYELKEVQEYWIQLIDEIRQYTNHYRLDQMKHYMTRNEGGTFLDNVLGRFGDGLHYGECILQSDDLSRMYYEQHNILPLVQDYQLWGYKHRMAFFESHDNHRSFLNSLWMNDAIRLQKWEELLRQSDFCIYYAHRDDNTIFSNTMKDINNRYN